MIAPPYRTATSRLAGLLLATALTACGDSEGPTDPDAPGLPPVSSVVVTPQSVELEMASTHDFEATTYDSGGAVLAGRSVNWTSSDPGVATVDSTGRATALTPGVSRIVATSEGVSDSASLTVVPVPAAAVIAEPADTLLEVGQSAQLTAEVRDGEGNPLAGRHVSWSSSAPTLATVSSDGLVEATGPGVAWIEAASEGFADTVVVTVVHAPVTLVGAGDIADCATPWDEKTALLLDAIPGTVFTLGDNAYEDGTADEFTNCYDPTWGRHKDRTYPAAGNHEYHSDAAAPYFAYFGTRAGDPEKGYYSYEAGAWKVIVLNSNANQVAVETGSPQETWLRAELAADDHACTLAYWHHPRFSDGSYGDDDRFDAFWQALYEYGADLVLVGHDHNYQRFGRLDPGGQPDPSNGIRQIVVGTGGRFLYSIATPRAELEAYDSDTYGVLKLTLRHDSYEWEFVPAAGQTFADSGKDVCH